MKRTLNCQVVCSFILRAFGTILTIAMLLSLGALVQESQAGQSTNVVQTNASVCTVTSQGANYRIWQRAIPVFTNGGGQINYRTNSYTELATGMNFLSNGQWQASSEAIQITADGGVATNGQHQVAFTADINTSNAVQITTPDGLQLKTHILGLSYYDALTGSNVLFAELTNSLGQVVNTNRVVYSNAFTDCDADVRYTYRRSGFEQDIVVQEQLPAPESYGLNSSNTWLQVWTEFLDAPTPAITSLQGGADQLLDFGTVHLPRGKAFIIGSGSNSVAVNKQWRTISGRTFLVEQVPFALILTDLQSLPPYSSGNGGALLRIPFKGFPKNLPPVPKMAKRSGESLKLASAAAKETGLVLDYSTVDGAATNFTFKGDTTYYVDGFYDLFGTTTIEGGTVIKFADIEPSDPTAGPFVGLGIEGTLICPTNAYQMAVLTSKDDDTAGETLDISTGTPVTGSWNYYFQWFFDYDFTLRNLRMSYATGGIAQGGAIDIWDCQFINCQDAVVLAFWGDDYGNYCNLHNVLMAGCGIGIFDSTDPDILLENVTSDCPSFTVNGAYLSSLTLKNCVITGYSDTPPSAYTNISSAINPAGTVFQTLGAGNYYLATNSPYRDCGTTNISPDLLAELAHKTTYPPIGPPDFPSASLQLVSANTTMEPQAQRDYDTPDLGYHYDPIDYMTIVDYSNCVVTMTNGVVLGYYRYIGISLDNASQLVSFGSPLQKNVIVYYNLVQEEPTNLGAGEGLTYPAQAIPVATYHPDTGQNPSVYLRFTSFFAQASTANIFYTPGNYEVANFTARDCENYGGGGAWNLYDQTGAVNLINNLFQYTQVYGEATGVFNVYNNLYRGTSGYAFYDFNGGGGTITNRNNAFDGTTANLGGTIGYNAYLNGATDDNTHTTGDIFTNLTWVVGPLGNFYQATNSPLLNATNITADQLGLYHYTVTTNQVKETNSWVDMGYHYVALGANGLPVDSNGDGIPDYLEDFNGNGIFDSGDLANWQGMGIPDTNGIIELQVYTPLR